MKYNQLQWQNNAYVMLRVPCVKQSVYKFNKITVRLCKTRITANTKNRENNEGYEKFESSVCVRR